MRKFMTACCVLIAGCSSNADKDPLAKPEVIVANKCLEKIAPGSGIRNAAIAVRFTEAQPKPIYLVTYYTPGLQPLDTEANASTAARNWLYPTQISLPVTASVHDMETAAGPVGSEAGEKRHAALERIYACKLALAKATIR